MSIVGIFVLLLVVFTLKVLTQIEHDDTPMNLFESRWVDQIPWPNPPPPEGKCNLPSQRYYLKKRRTMRTIQGQTLGYQFIASSENLGDGIMDPTSIRGEPDHFPSQYGWVFCEMGVINGLEMLLRARHCGIEELLVSLCAMDNDVNPGENINLDLNQVYPNGLNVVNNQWFRNLTMEYCTKFIEVKLPISRFSENFNPRRLLRLYGISNPTQILHRSWLFDVLEYYVEGLYLADGDNVVLIQRCGDYVSWRNYKIDDFRFSRQFVRNTYYDTEGESWYFCI